MTEWDEIKRIALTKDPKEPYLSAEETLLLIAQRQRAFEEYNYNNHRVWTTSQELAVKDNEIRSLRATIEGLLGASGDERLYRRIGNQRRELKQSNFWRDFWERKYRELQKKSYRDR